MGSWRRWRRSFRSSSKSTMWSEQRLLKMRSMCLWSKCHWTWTNRCVPAWSAKRNTKANRFLSRPMPSGPLQWEHRHESFKSRPCRKPRKHSSVNWESKPPERSWKPPDPRQSDNTSPSWKHKQKKEDMKAWVSRPRMITPHHMPKRWWLNMSPQKFKRLKYRLRQPRLKRKGRSCRKRRRPKPLRSCQRRWRPRQKWKRSKEQEYRQWGKYLSKCNARRRQRK